MNIVIVGDGKVGHALSKSLYKEDHEITIIDSDSKTLETTQNTLDVTIVRGNGASIDCQIEAGTANADVLIAVTSQDEVNMVCCLLAKKLGTKSTIARIRNPEYQSQMHILSEELNLTWHINPEHATAREMFQLIRFPAALRLDTFVKGKVELIEFKIRENNLLIGENLINLQKLSDAKILICAVERENEAFIPDGHFVLMENDKIHITGMPKEIQRFIKNVGGIEQRISSVIILGGSRIAYYLSRLLLDLGIDVTIIEIREERCLELSKLLPAATIINADGTNPEVLQEEGLSSAGAFVALTNIDEENMVASMIAQEENVPKVITKINRFNYMSILKRMGLESVISPKVTTVSQILRFVRAMQNREGSQVVTLHKIVNEKAEAMEFVANESTNFLNVPLMDVPIKKNVIIAAIARKSKIIIPGGKDFVSKGDNVIIVTTLENIDDLNDIFLD